MNAPQRTGRRQFLTTAGAVTATTTLGGCLGVGEDDSRNDGSTDASTDDRFEELQVNGRYLNSPRPLELVEPSVEPFEGVSRGGQGVAHVHWHPDEGHAHWHFQPVEVPLNGVRRVRSRFVDADEQSELLLGEDDRYEQRVRVLDDGAAGDSEADVDVGVDGNIVEFVGIVPGRVRVVYELYVDGALRWESPELLVEVVEDEPDGE